MRPFETDEKRFRAGTTFEQIVETYNFDRRLRLLCLDAIERIEVALRSQIINVMGKHGGPHFYYEESFFSNKRAVTRIRNLGEKAEHLSITHYKRKYMDPYLPAIWCLTEASTFGQVSVIYADLEREYRKEIAKSFNLDESVCVSWFKCLSMLRNICAHHGRLWNASLVVNKPQKAKLYEEDLNQNESCYSRLVILRVLIGNIEPNDGYGWIPDLKKFINDRPKVIALDAMGIPINWQSRLLWK